MEVLIIEYFAWQYLKLKLFVIFAFKYFRCWLLRHHAQCSFQWLNKNNLIKITWSRFQLQIEEDFGWSSCPNMTDVHCGGGRALPRPYSLQAEAKEMSWWRAVGGEWARRCLHHRYSESVSVTQHPSAIAVVHLAANRPPKQSYFLRMSRP